MALSRGTSAFTLKMAAIAGMSCNHVANVFGDVMAPAATMILFTLGGITFPIMAFLLCEGYRHTSSIRRYATRLALFAVAAEVPWFLLWGPALNVLFTLLIGLGLLWARDHLRGRGAYGLVIVAGVAASWLCDWAIAGPLMIVFFHRVREQPRGVLKVMAAFGAVFGIPQLISVWGAGLGAAGGLPPAIQWGALGYYTLGFALATFLMTTYNGQRGPSLKWFFYAYYPAHLLVLWLVAQFV